MAHIREQEKLKILLKKVKLYLSFSIPFLAISFPLILSLNPISSQEISEIWIIFLSRLFLIFSLLIFAISILLSLYAFNGLNTLKENNKNEITIIVISFYSTFVDISNYLNIWGFFLMVLYLSLIIAENICLMLSTGGIIILSFIVFELLRNYIFKKASVKSSKNSK